MRNFLPILYIVCSAFLIGNPFYFAEDILYGDNNPKKDFGVYEIVSGPIERHRYNFIEWNRNIEQLFNTKTGNEWPSSMSNCITEHNLVVDCTRCSFFTIKEKDFALFKRIIKQLKRKNDDWFEVFDFVYLDADSGIMPKILKAFDIDAGTLKGDKFIFIINAEAIISKDDARRSYVVYDNQSTLGYQLYIKLNDLGVDKWADFTRNNIGRFALIVMDNKIISMPYINSEILNGSCYIDGFKSIKEAERLKNQLNY